MKRGGTLKYLIKYIAKTGEKIVYGRGIPAEICIELADSDIAGTFMDFVTKYVLFDDVIDWERDVKDYGKKRRVERERKFIVKRKANAATPVRECTRRILAYENFRKKITAAFRKRISAKATVFSVFKSVS